MVGRKKIKPQSEVILGWREWVALPELGINHIKAKIDTGARSSALHAFSIKPFRTRGKTKVKFDIHPFQRRYDKVISCTAVVHDQRWVTDSGGHRELRYVIKTPITLAGMAWPIEVTLTNRDTMNFRMLLGRTAMSKRFVVDPSASYLVSSKRRLK